VAYSSEATAQATGRASIVSFSRRFDVVLPCVQVTQVGRS
jgi:hypothetical protein